MKNHRYTLFPYPFVIPLSNIIGICCLVFGIVSALLSITGKTNPNTGFFIIYGFVSILVANSYPAIDADEDGLFVHFCFFRLRVKWDDIVEVKNSFGNYLGFFPFDSFVVRTRALTLFHRLYGSSLFSLQPSFLVHSHISGFPKLFASIKNKKLILTNAEVVA